MKIFLKILFYIFVRAVNILPNNIVEVIGKHAQFPIESLSLSYCQDILVSCSHDQKVKIHFSRNIQFFYFIKHFSYVQIKFWNISHLYDLNTERPEEVKAHKKVKRRNFFEDL